jgi:hypothetical protein
MARRIAEQMSDNICIVRFLPDKQKRHPTGWRFCFIQLYPACDAYLFDLLESPLPPNVDPDDFVPILNRLIV